MKSICNIAAATLMIGAIAGAQGQDWNSHTRIVTTSNAATNQLLVYNSSVSESVLERAGRCALTRRIYLDLLHLAMYM